MADVVIPVMPPSTPCIFRLAWRGKCGKPTDNGWCNKHEALTCVVCNKKATRMCDYTGSGPFVCGASLCDSCQHEENPKSPFPPFGHSISEAQPCA